MKYDFDKIISRERSGSVKWDLRETRGDKDLLPMWVADMDYKAPPEVIESLVKRAEHGIFGYTYPPDSYKDAVITWMKKRHNWAIEKEWIIVTPGVVPAVSIAINTYTNPGDRICIQPPVYHPFKKVIEENNRVAIGNRLIHNNNHYHMDFEDLERILKKGVSMFILCSPHNPVGRVWSIEELARLAELCAEYDTLIISDDIHSDLIMPGYKHKVMAGVSPRLSKGIVTMTSASKTFNLAGLSCSNIIIENPELRDAFKRTIDKHAISMPNIFGLVATEAAYHYCEEWLEELMLYIQGNFDFLKTYIVKNIPEIQVTRLEGTYLSWLDFSRFGLSDESISEILFKKAKVWLDNGPQFGAGGEGFQRMNLACSRSTLEEAISRIGRAFKEF